MIQAYAVNQLERPQNQRIRDERDRREQRTGRHCKETETTVLRVHDHSTEPLHIHFSRSSGWQMQRKTTEKMDK